MRRRVENPRVRAAYACAVCGRPLSVWDSVLALDGSRVCAADCLGAHLATVPESARECHPAARPDDPPAWGDPDSYGEPRGSSFWEELPE
jgi:hypothetical protein